MVLLPEPSCPSRRSLWTLRGSNKPGNRLECRTLPSPTPTFERGVGNEKNGYNSLMDAWDQNSHMKHYMQVYILTWLLTHCSVVNNSYPKPMHPTYTYQSPKAPEKINPSNVQISNAQTKYLHQVLSFPYAYFNQIESKQETMGLHIMKPTFSQRLPSLPQIFPFTFLKPSSE